MRTVPAVKAALVDLLTPVLTDAQVIYSGRSSVTITKNKIVTIGTRAVGDSEFTALDRTGGGLERYRLDCQVQVTLVGTGLEAADSAAGDLWTAVCDAINAHQFSTDGTLIVTASGSFEFESAADKDGRYSSVKFGADVVAVI